MHEKSHVSSAIKYDCLSWTALAIVELGPVHMNPGQ